MKYTQEHVNYIREITKETYIANKELANLFNEHFKENINENSIYYLKKKYKIKFKTNNYTEEEINYLKEISPGRSRKEIHRMFNEKFNGKRTLAALNSIRKELNIKTGNNGRYKKGAKPHNFEEIGSEVIRSQNRSYIKIAEPNIWQSKNRYLYEKYNNEKLADDDVVIFLDSNKENFRKENLVKLSRNQLKLMNQHGLSAENKEIRMAGINIAKLLDKIYEKKKEI